MLRVAVATSGGRDSTALLHCTVRAMAEWGGETWALHVHHGLQAPADEWLVQLRAQALRWGACFDSRRLDDSPAPGDSVEAWARRRRYQALSEMALQAGCDLVLLAHHRRDQAETWLLQALRGAGPRGLSAMPSSARRGGITWARPWLNLPREAIEAYVRRHRIRYVDDPSNNDPRYARNRLRGGVWPALIAAFADAETALNASARHAQQARALAREVLAQDLPAVQRDSGLDLGRWLQLPDARRLNALQGWLALHMPGGVPDSLLQRLCQELPGSTSGRWLASASELHLHRGVLHSVPEAATSAGEAVDGWSITGPGLHQLPGWLGHIEVSSTDTQGLSPDLLDGLQVRPRQGGEQFKLAPRATARSLKKQYQARAVPVWQREGPLLYSRHGQLLFVPGLGVDAAAWAAEGQPQFALRWVPAAAAAQAATGLRQTSG